MEDSVSPHEKETTELAIGEEVTEDKTLEECNAPEEELEDIASVNEDTAAVESAMAEKLASSPIRTVQSKVKSVSQP